MSDKSKSTNDPLEQLLARAEHYADFALRKSGRLAPTLFVDGVNGLVMFIPESLQDARDKDDFVIMARLVCIAHAATAAVMALEGWVTFGKPGEPLDDTPPSEAFDRRECLVLIGESRAERKQKLLPIVRSHSGAFFGFGEDHKLQADTFTGRFAEILPPREPSEQQCAMAEVLLKLKGVRLELSKSGKPAFSND